MAVCTRIIESKTASQAERASAYEHRADQHSREHRDGEVVSDLDRAIELEPTAPRYRQRGFHLYLTKQYARAIPDFDKAIAADPGNNYYLKYRAKAFLKMGDAARALADFDKAVALTPDDSDAYSARADAYIERKESAKALADLDRAIMLLPDGIFSYMRRARLFHELGHQDKAVADLARVIEIEPNEVTGYINRALMYEDMGRMDAAIADYDKLISMRPDETWYRTRRASLEKHRSGASVAAPATAGAQKDPRAGRATAAGESDCRRYVPAVNLIVPVRCLD